MKKLLFVLFLTGCSAEMKVDSRPEPTPVPKPARLVQIEPFLRIADVTYAAVECGIIKDTVTNREYLICDCYHGGVTVKELHE